MEQQGDVTVTLHLDTASTANYGDPTTPANLEDPPAADITTEAPPSYNGRVDLNTNYVVYNRKTTGEGYGLRLTRQPLDTDWYYQETEVIVSNPLTIVWIAIPLLIQTLFIFSIGYFAKKFPAGLLFDSN